MRKVENNDGRFHVVDSDGTSVAYGMTEDEACCWLDGWAHAQGGDGYIRQAINTPDREPSG